MLGPPLFFRRDIVSLLISPSAIWQSSLTRNLLQAAKRGGPTQRIQSILILKILNFFKVLIFHFVQIFTFEFLKILLIEFLEKELPIVSFVLIFELCWFLADGFFALEKEVFPAAMADPGSISVVHMCKFGPITGVNYKRGDSDFLSSKEAHIDREELNIVDELFMGREKDEILFETYLDIEQEKWLVCCAFVEICIDSEKMIAFCLFCLRVVVSHDEIFM